jgi:hypothetical protein
MLLTLMQTLKPSQKPFGWKGLQFAQRHLTYFAFASFHHPSEGTRLFEKYAIARAAKAY